VRKKNIRSSYKPGTNMKALEKLIADCKRQGVTFDIRAESVYFSGYTLAFEFFVPRKAPLT
jgi:hypothetical protein